MIFKLFTTQALVFLAYALSVRGIALPVEIGSLAKRDDGFVKLDFIVNKNSSLKTGLLQKRYPTSPLANVGNSYDITLNFGSNEQAIAVTLDTGSADLWVPSSNYSSSESSTYKSTGEEFSIQYVSGSALGEYVTDTVSIPGGVSLSNFQFGDVTSANAGGGVLGISYPNDEATSNTYPNFPASLKNAGYISKNAYSLYLNDLEATSGSIIFGGYDTEKFEGELVSVQDSDANQVLEVKLNSLTTSKGLKFPVDFSVPLDSGTTVIYLPGFLVAAIAEAAGLNYNFIFEYISLDCDSQLSGNIEFEFNGITIPVPLQSLIVNAGGTCLLGILGNLNSHGVNILGDTFLRSVYLVYNLDDNVIQIAPAKYTSASNIVAISS